MSDKTGGPAFPQNYEFRNGKAGSEGMSLRDYFAAAALTGIANEYGSSAEERAQRCYQYADAMLAEREKL